MTMTVTVSYGEIIIFVLAYVACDWVVNLIKRQPYVDPCDRSYE